ncbi:hypothetical protein CC2G_002816 [Coprinopsis cinerea AmutBmut pab1-1]|nr:hypothetical protein CC2G_002816 [Coprinopsis cinerea AmutBmut pab1-1]
MAFSTFVFLTLLGSAYAANDWSKPCLSGECFYDLPSSDNGPSGTLKIWGPSDSISDITTAAGWEIIECKKDALSQDIRLVCTGDAKCAHLYKSIGAVGKIVRLPESCGSNAFAHVSRAWVPEDQSIPEHISKRLVRRNGVQPEVKALHLDTDFGALDTARIGTVYFALTGANVPGAKDVVDFPSARSKRNIFKKAKNFVKNAASKVKETTTKVVDTVKETTNKVVDAVVDKVEDVNTVEVDESTTLPPLTLDKTFTLVDQQLTCPPLDGRLKIDVDAKARAVATIGVAAEGTIVPPRITDFAVITTLDGQIDGAVDLSAGLTGSIDSGKIKLVELGIPGLDFPGILTIGPTFRVDAQANAQLDLSADVQVGISYTLNKATLVFPSDSKKAQAQGGAFKIGDTPLKLSVVPSVKATGTVEAHLIPSLNLGISALGGVADARVFVELDASAAMKLELEGRAEAGVTVNRAPAQQQQPRAIEAPPAKREVAIRGSNALGNAYFARQLSTQTNVSGGFGGCFEILAGLDVNAGADAEFFGLFDAGTKVPLFNRDFELFKRCFGNQARIQRRVVGRYARVVVARSSVEGGRLERRLECPAGVEQEVAPEPLVDEVVPAAQIKALA